MAKYTKKYIIAALFYLIVCLILILSFGCTHKKGGVPDSASGDMPNAEKASPGEMAPGISLPEGFERKVHRTFSIIMPSEWREVEYNNMIFYLPPGSEIVDPISEKVEVIAAGLPKENRLPLKEILEAGLDDTKKLVPDLVMAKEEETRVGNTYAVKMIFTGTIMGKKFENTQISTINKDIMLHIVHNCFEENCQYPDIYNQMAESIELIQYTDDKK